MAEVFSPSFQSIILKLQSFWADRGCVIWQPYHTEVGAGTLNPATALRVLGPEPWRVAYVEPSIRPADGRYAENPNRWQHYYQFQVILKPDPGNPQELFLDSLIALGVDPAKHDIRFVEDNWEAPALGAWGLGWEVWLDGQEITQFTYFQQAGGHTLDPVSVEITYGIERIAVALQGVDNFLDLEWTSDLTYGDIYLEPEREFSRYNFELANVERLRTLFDQYEAEADAALKSDLVYPSHDYVLKCSHVFNILDSRGVVGVTERAALFARMRSLSQRVADAYLAQREALGFPWLEPPAPAAPAEPGEEPAEPRSEPADFLLEVGTEELPASDLSSALEQMREGFSALLSESRLQHGELRIMGTPRRLVAFVEALAPRQDAEVTLVKGPPAERAYDSEGKPTRAAEGFAARRDLKVEELQLREIEGGQYVVAEVHEPGRPAVEVLADRLPTLIERLRFDKSMRWDESGASFSRPIRWLLALHGEDIVPFEFAGLRSGRTTRGLRFHADGRLSANSPAEYLGCLEGQGILLDFQLRRDAVQRQADSLAEEVGGRVPQDADLLEEVTNLVEAPTALRGGFDERFLELPRPVLIAVMKEHQRYFPVEAGERLLPYFIAVRNGGAEHVDDVTRGNENVLRARFADAAYFLKRDLDQPLEEYLPRLGTLTFHTELGSMLDKVHRIERLVEALADPFELVGEDRSHALRAAHLSKADLVTMMVVEMTSLQGEVGRLYALQAGEPQPVAHAIYEHYLPRAAGDAVPESKPGIVLGIADRLDTLMGLFAVGIRPTGGGDPYGLRRAALGLIQILVDHGLGFDLRRGLRMAAAELPVEASEEASSSAFEFVVGRQERLLREQGFPYDVVAAVLAEQGHNPAGVVAAVEALRGWTSREDWPDLLNAYARCARITRGLEVQGKVLPELLSEPAEVALNEALDTAEAVSRRSGSVDDLFKVFQPLVPAISAFFDEVLVMAEDPAVRQNRLRLVQRVVTLAEGVADISRLEGF